MIIETYYCSKKKMYICKCGDLEVPCEHFKEGKCLYAEGSVEGSAGPSSKVSEEVKDEEIKI